MGTTVSEIGVPRVGCKLASPDNGDWTIRPTQRRGDSDGDEQVPSRLWTLLGGFHARQWQRRTPAFRVELMKRSETQPLLPPYPTASAAGCTRINKYKSVMSSIMNGKGLLTPTEQALIRFHRPFTLGDVYACQSTSFPLRFVGEDLVFQFSHAV